jgi:hypothetical protein
MIPPWDGASAPGVNWALGLGPSRAEGRSAGIRLFDVSKAKPQATPSSEIHRLAVIRQLEGSTADTMRSVQALEGKLTAAETEQILSAIERAKKALADGGFDELQSCLADLEKATGLIGQAMLRP